MSAKRTIWKFHIPMSSSSRVELNIPRGFKILDLQVQHGQPCIWAVVDPKAPKVPVQFMVVGTGFEVDAELLTNHVGTFQVSRGEFVFHLFQL